MLMNKNENLLKMLLNGQTIDEALKNSQQEIKKITARKKPRHFKVTHHGHGYITTNMYSTEIGSKEDKESNLTVEESMQLLLNKQRKEKYQLMVKKLINMLKINKTI